MIRCVLRATSGRSSLRSMLAVGGHSSGGGQCLPQPQPQPRLRRQHLRPQLRAISASAAAGAGGISRRALVLPVDHSQDSEFAVDWALGNLYRTGDVLHLLHCIPANSGGRTTFSDGVNEQLVTVDTASGADAIIKQRHWAIMDAVRKQFEAKLLAAAVPAEDLVYDIVQERRPDVTVSGMFGMTALVQDVIPPEVGNAGESFETAGMVGDAIVLKAEEVDAAAVVMASHGKSSLAEFFLGSITNFCTHHCTQPVVVLHNLPHASGSGVGAGSTVAGVGRQLAVAVDDSAHSEKALQWTMDHLYREGDTVHLLHVVPKVAQQMAVSDGLGTTIAALEVRHAHSDETVSQRFQQMLDGGGVPYKVDLIKEMRDDSVRSLGTAIVDKARDLGASSIVMASHNRGFFEEFVLGSVTNYVTHHCTDIPVVVLHP
mmetsp:Transcript_355/g.944  ORF Transcript_355/g.944 Transcript_355/m.944 type:complete len:430 (-) Transcript_355:66-1355(-)